MGAINTVKKRFALLALLSTLFCMPAQAAEPSPIGSFGDWKAFYFNDGSGKVCFMSSQPQKQEGKFTKRGEVFFFVTHWEADKKKDVVSISTGYPFKKESQAKVVIDGQTYHMTTDGEMAWANDAETDGRIAASIQKGSSLVIEGTSQRGTLTKDTYSLKGSADAYQAITKECGF